METALKGFARRKSRHLHGAYPIFAPRNLDRYPRLDTVLMVEKAIYDSRGDRTVTRIWKGLPRKVLWTTFTTILDYLEYSGKIHIEDDKTVSWLWDPEGVHKVLSNPKLVIK